MEDVLVYAIIPLSDFIEKDFQEMMNDLQGEESWEAMIAKQEGILKMYGIDESYFVCVSPTWRDFASVLKNSKDQDPNEFFERRLRECLGIKKEPAELEDHEQTETALMINIDQAENRGQYKLACELQKLVIKKLQKRIMQSEQL